MLFFCAFFAIHGFYSTTYNILNEFRENLEKTCLTRCQKNEDAKKTYVK